MLQIFFRKLALNRTVPICLEARRHLIFAKKQVVKIVNFDCWLGF